MTSQDKIKQKSIIGDNTPIKEYEYFGCKIVETKTRFIGYVKDKSGETIEVESYSLSEVKLNIDDVMRKIERDDVIDRLMTFADTDKAHAERIFKLISHFHSCEGAAVRNINDYLNEHNYL